DDVTGISVLRVKNDVCVASGAGSTVTLSQTPPKFSTAEATSVTIYLGTATQNADPLIESYFPTGNVPARRLKAYAVVEGLQLGSSPNVMPSFQALVGKTASPQSLASAI